MSTKSFEKKKGESKPREKQAETKVSEDKRDKQVEKIDTETRSVSKSKEKQVDKAETKLSETKPRESKVRRKEKVETKKVHTLTCEGEYFVSSMEVKSVPEEDFCLVEIEYDAWKIFKIAGLLKKGEEKRECVLENIDLSSFQEKYEQFFHSSMADTSKIYLNFVEDVDNNYETTIKIFVILVSCYLVYVQFLDFPYTISMELLEMRYIKEFLETVPLNSLEDSFLEQISLLQRYFFNVITNKKQGEMSEFEERCLEEEKKRKEVMGEMEALIEEIKEYKRKMISDIDKRLKKV